MRNAYAQRSLQVLPAHRRPPVAHVERIVTSHLRVRRDRRTPRRCMLNALVDVLCIRIDNQHGGTSRVKTAISRPLALRA